MQQSIQRGNVANSYSALIKLAFPAIISMMSVTFMGMADTIMVGRLGSTELAAVGMGGMLVFTLLSFMWGLSGSVTTLVSHYVGARQFELCDRVLRNALLLISFLGVAFFCFSFFTLQFFGWMDPSPEVQALGAAYAKWRLMGGIFVAFNFLMTGYFQGLGDTKSPMWLSLIANLVNILLDYLFIFDHGRFGGYGVEGAAWATVISNIISSSLFFLIYAKRRKAGPHELGRDASFVDRIQLKKLIKLSIPMGLQNFLAIASFLALATVVGWVGVADLAGYQIAIQLDHLSFMPVLGIAQATQVMVGQFLGSGNRHGAWIGVKRSFLMAALFEGVIAILCFVFARDIFSFFSSDPDVIHLGGQILLLAPVWMVSDSIYVICFSVLRGAGDVNWSMIVGACLHWLKIPVAYLAGVTYGYGLLGVWTVVTLHILIAALIFYWRVYRGKWMDIRLVHPMMPIKSDNP